MTTVMGSRRSKWTACAMDWACAVAGASAASGAVEVAKLSGAVTVGLHTGSSHSPLSLMLCHCRCWRRAVCIPLWA